LKGSSGWPPIAAAFLRFLTRMREICLSGLQLFSISSLPGFAQLIPGKQP
jgi:hypothetical protein